MKILIVKRPLQDENTKPEDIQYFDGIAPKWIVETFMYRESDGGMKKWFDALEEKKPDVVYLYDIKALQQKIVNGTNENDWIDDIVYYVRAKLKKNPIDYIKNEQR